jgi:hypothetical protein
MYPLPYSFFYLSLVRLLIPCSKNARKGDIYRNSHDWRKTVQGIKLPFSRLITSTLCVYDESLMTMEYKLYCRQNSSQRAGARKPSRQSRVEVVEIKHATTVSVKKRMVGQISSK